MATNSPVTILKLPSLFRYLRRVLFWIWLLMYRRVRSFPGLRVPWNRCRYLFTAWSDTHTSFTPLLHSPFLYRIRRWRCCAPLLTSSVRGNCSVWARGFSRSMPNKRVRQWVASGKWKVASWQLQVDGSELQVDSSELQVDSCRLIVAGCRLIVLSCRWWVACCKLIVVSCRLQVISYRLLGCRLQVAGYGKSEKSNN